MKAITKTSRANTALQVIQHMNDGMTVVDACKEVGIPRSTFYDIVKKNPVAVAEYQEMVEANSREQLGLILFHRTEILQNVIDDGLSDQTSPRDRLAIYKTLSELADNLTYALGLDSDADQRAQEFLMQGPKLVTSKSRLTATQTTITIESEN